MLVHIASKGYGSVRRDAGTQGRRDAGTQGRRAAQRFVFARGTVSQV